MTPETGAPPGLSKKRMLARAVAPLLPLLLLGCAPRNAVTEDEAPVLYTFEPELRARIVERLDPDGVRLLEHATAFDVALHRTRDDPPQSGPVIAERRIDEDSERAQVVQFFYDVAASRDPPCKCEPVLSYLVTATDGSAEARVLGHPVAVRVAQRELSQVPPLRAEQTLSALLPEPAPP